ncbi:MAG: hypothetical protein AAB521_01980 [Patescibacteria group bacterium]
MSDVSGEREPPKEISAQFPKVSLDTVYKIGDLILAGEEEGKYSEFDQMMSKTQDGIIRDEPDLLEFLQGQLEDDPETAVEFISGVMFVRAAFDAEGIKLPPVTWSASMAIAQEHLFKQQKIRRITDLDARNALKGTESVIIPHPIDLAEENPSLMSFISALGVTEDGLFTAFGKGAMYYYEVKRKQFFAEQIRKSPFGNEVKAEGGDQDKEQAPPFLEFKTFEVEGDMWDYEELAEVSGKIGEAFLDRFYKTQPEDERKRELESFIHRIRAGNETPLRFFEDMAVLPQATEGYVQLTFQRHYDAEESTGPLEYDEEERLILPLENPPRKPAKEAIINDCVINITARPAALVELQSKFPEKGRELKEDVRDFAENAPKLVEGLSVGMGIDLGDFLPDIEKKYPYGLPRTISLHFDPNIFKKGRGRIKIMGEKYWDRENLSDA